MIVLDGVYTAGGSGQPRFHPVPAPHQAQLQALLNRLIQRLVRRLERDGLLIADAEQTWLDFDPDESMDSIRAASTRYRIAIGPHSGRRTLTLHDPAFVRSDTPAKILTADRDGFSLNAAVACQPWQRDRLERLCRYVTRPAICLDRLTERTDGQIQYELKNPFRDGTTHILFSPLDFISRLAALVPRPRYHLVRYHGVLAPNSKLRQRIVPKRRQRAPERHAAKRDHGEPMPAENRFEGQPLAPLTWAQRLKRVFNIDITLCPRCGGTLRVIADITDPDVIQTILDQVAARPPPVSHAIRTASHL